MHATTYIYTARTIIYKVLLMRPNQPTVQLSKSAESTNYAHIIVKYHWNLQSEFEKVPMDMSAPKSTITDL